MPVHESEAIILQSYPLGEADRLVSFFSRTMGRVRGVAAGARRTKSRFGSTLERLSHVRIWFFERPSRELVRINQCELVESFLDTGHAPIIVLDVFSLPILELFQRICSLRSMAVITLYAEDAVLARRMARRSSGYINTEVAIKVNRLMKPPCDSSDAWINTSSLGPAEVFAEIARQVERIAKEGKR